MASNSERALQLNYWKEHSVVLSVEAMMLDSQASKLDKEERPEILSLLPPLEGKSVVELGAGIGRYTAELAKNAYHVLAVDFVESMIKKNEETNKDFKNIQFMCTDVTSSDLKIEPGSIDLVFSNWLLMYLSDMEVEELAKKMVQWVKMGGYIFFRESCFHQSGDQKRKDNPTHYREPKFYNKVYSKIFKECEVTAASGITSELSLVSFKCIGAYVRNKKNQNQVCWLWQKVKSAGNKGLRKTFNGVQYACSDILWYERMFGEGFVTIGGLDTTKEFVDKLELKAGQKVLDVGCGIGGSDFYMAENFDVEVVAIDLSVNMVSFALERAIGRKCAIEFEVADFSGKEYPPDTFDVVYSRDTLLHIQDKATLFRKFFKWLKPGGKLLISDYCKAQATISSEFQDYTKQHENYLHDVEAYGQLLRDCEFCDVVAEDHTDQFIKIMEKELSVLEKSWNTLICDFSVEDNASIVDGWKGELNRALQGELRWGVFLAKKRLICWN